MNGAATLVPGERLERAGACLVRWSLVFLLLFFGALKWTTHEAESIRPLIVNSPLLGWLDRVLGPQGASEFIGLVEITTAALIAARWWAPQLTAVGGVLGMGMFVTTLSFIGTTPNVGDGAGFLLKDLTLLGTAAWVAGEAWATIARRRLSNSRPLETERGKPQ